VYLRLSGTRLEHGMEQRISLVTLGVEDLGRSRRFYERLGWKRAVAAAEGVAFYQAGCMALALYPRSDLAKDMGATAERAGPAGISLGHNVGTRDGVDRVMEEAEAAGARILKAAEETFWGGYAGYFADPDGFAWEIAWNPGFPLAEDGSLQLPA
jgi:uncharacterized protein